MTTTTNAETTETTRDETKADPPGPPPDANFDLVLLDPAQVTLFRTNGAAVRATITDPVLGPERTYLRVQVARAFPLSLPDRYIGLRDDKDKEIGMLVTLDGLDRDSRAILDEELARRYFVPKILRFISFTEDFGNYTFTVETDRGESTFPVSNLRDSLTELLPRGRYLLTDREGERYEIPDIERLDAKTYALLQRFV
jgi:hypothetical protein